MTHSYDQPNASPAARRIAIDASDAGLQVLSVADTVTISGATAAIDRLFDRLEPTPPIRDCSGQLHLFDPAVYDRMAVAGADLVLTPTSECRSTGHEPRVAS